ncbi:hypothetical protein ACQZ3V_01775 [Ralstonia pseudosolanacearum]|uniref:hypothetical protein n=1 Tax=Ralstonia pseudosolanacearum TaxID=1310165 RepID=UPI001FFACB26
MAALTRCPYSTDVLDGTEPENEEHIVPVALGAPLSFTVRAKAAKNSEMNALVDAPAIHDPILRMVAMAQGVESRSGAVSAQLDGIVEGSGQAVRIHLSSESVGFKFRNPVERDITSGAVTGVYGFGDDAQNLADQVVRDSVRKGKQVVLGEVESTQPEVQARAPMNLHIVRRELTKIAYLMMVRVFGDEAILSPGGATYRAAMLAPTMDAFKATGIRGSTFQQLPPGMPRPGASQHALVCVRLGDQIVSAVSLFGTFNALFSSSADGFSVEEGSGEVVVIEVATSRLSSYSYLSVVTDLIQTGLPRQA